MQYANITVSDLNRADFGLVDLSQEELTLAGGFGKFGFGGFGGFAQANSQAQALNFGFGKAIANSQAQALNFSPFGGGAVANSSASAISGAGFAKKYW